MPCEIEICINTIISIDKGTMKRDQSKSSHDGSKDRYRVLVETIPYGVEEIDTTGAIIFCNPACSNMLGFSSEELCGMKVWDLSTTDAEISKLESKFSAVLSGRQVPSPYSTFRRTADGRAIEVHVDWAYLRDDAGKIAGFTSIVSDITERRRVEQALMESEERFRGLAEASFGAVVIVEGSRIVDFSDKALDIYGYDSSELLGKEVYTLMAPEQRAGLKERIARCQTDPTESVNVSRSGKRFPVEVSGAMFSHEGRQRIVFAVRDITERKRAERELSRQALIWTQLADAVRVMARDGVIVDANLEPNTCLAIRRPNCRVGSARPCTRKIPVAPSAGRSPRRCGATGAGPVRPRQFARTVSN